MYDNYCIGKLHTRYMLHITVFFGALCLFVNLYLPISFKSTAIDVIFNWGYVFPLIISMTYGVRYGLFSSMIGNSFIFFTDSVSSNYGMYVFVVTNSWICWHGFWSEYFRNRFNRRIEDKCSTTLYSYLIEGVFRLIDVAVLFILFYFSISLIDPTDWFVSDKTVYNFIIINNIMSYYILLLISDIFLNISTFREFLGLTISKDQNKISLIISIACFVSLIYWFADAIFLYLYYDVISRSILLNKPSSLIDSVVLNVPVYSIYKRLLFFISCLISGLVVSKYVSKYRYSLIDKKQEELKYRQLFDGIKLGVAIYQPVNDGKDFICINFNTAAQNIDKFDKKNIIGKSIFELFPNIRKFGLIDIMNDVYATGNPKHQDVAYYGDHIRIGWRSNYVYKLPEGDLVVVYSDETDSVEREREIARYQRELILRNDISNIFLFEGEHELREKLVKKLSDYIGGDIGFFCHKKSYDEIIELHDVDLVSVYNGVSMHTEHVIDLDYIRDIVRDSIENKTVCARNNYNHHYPKSNVSVNNFITVPILSANCVIGVFGVMNRESHFIGSDIELSTGISNLISPILETKIESMKRKTNLIKSKAKYRELFETAPIGIFISTRSGLLIDANSFFVNLFEFDSLEEFKEYCGKYKIESLYKDRYKRKGIMDILTNSNDWTKFTIEYVTIGNSGITCEVTMRMNSDTGEDMIQGYVRDITEKITSEQILKHKEEQLRKSQKLETVGTLAGGIAHDFNNILQVIMGYGEMLLTTIEKEENIKRVNEILSVSKRGGRLAKQLLIFSRKVESNIQVVDVRDIMDNIKTILQSVLPKMINFTICISEDIHNINADIIQIEQVLMNLSLNARDAMCDGGDLRISAKNACAKNDPVLESGNYVSISVEDTGPGIPVDVREKIFEPFFTTKEIGKGTGLGLSIVYGIVQNHKGKIKVYSEEGVGTTFEVYIPATVESKVVERITMEEFQMNPENNNILIVDDEISILKFGKDLLSLCGFTVYTASKCDECMDVINSIKIDLIIIDLLMPEIGGLTCIDLLRENDMNIKIIVASGAIDEKTLDEINNRKCLFISKPYTKNQLLKKINEAIGDDVCTR